MATYCVCDIDKFISLYTFTNSQCDQLPVSLIVWDCRGDGFESHSSLICSGFNITAVLKVEFKTDNCNDHLYLNTIITGTFQCQYKD